MFRDKLREMASSSATEPCLAIALADSFGGRSVWRLIMYRPSFPTTDVDCRISIQLVSQTPSGGRQRRKQTGRKIARDVGRGYKRKRHRYSEREVHVLTRSG